VSARAKVISGTVAVALLAAGGAAFAAVKLTSTSHTATVPLATAPFGDGVGSYGLGGGRLGGRGFGGGLGPVDGGGPGFGFRSFFGSGMNAAAAYLGLSAAQLRTDLFGGQTLAQIAKSQGKTLDGLVTAMVAQVKKGLSAAVSNGVMTQAQADQIASRLQARLKDMANGVRPQRGTGGGFGPGDGFGPGGGIGPGGPSSQSGTGSGSFGSNA
jgi:hypothetical protein